MAAPVHARWGAAPEMGIFTERILVGVVTMPALAAPGFTVLVIVKTVLDVTEATVKMPLYALGVAPAIVTEPNCVTVYAELVVTVHAEPDAVILETDLKKPVSTAVAASEMVPLTAPGCAVFAIVNCVVETTVLTKNAPLYATGVAPLMVTGLPAKIEIAADVVTVQRTPFVVIPPAGIVVVSGVATLYSSRNTGAGAAVRELDASPIRRTTREPVEKDVAVAATAWTVNEYADAGVDGAPVVADSCTWRTLLVAVVRLA